MIYDVKIPYMKNIVLITSNEIRHKFFRKILCNTKGINLKLCIVEDTHHRQSRQIFKNKNLSKKIKEYFLYRDKIEDDFFFDYVQSVNEPKKIIKCKKGEFNFKEKILNKIEKSKPDLIISYGCSLIREKLINKYSNKFLNIHLGLSPYFKGVGSNFWAYIQNKPELIGSTIMMIDPGIDSGRIIHQLRTKIFMRDNFHIISARLIRDTVFALIKVIKNFKKIKSYNQWDSNISHTFYKKDFNDSKINVFDKINHAKLLNKYIKNKKKRDSKFKLIKSV